MFGASDDISLSMNALLLSTTLAGPSIPVVRTVRIRAITWPFEAAGCGDSNKDAANMRNQAQAGNLAQDREGKFAVSLLGRRDSPRPTGCFFGPAIRAEMITVREGATRYPPHVLAPTRTF
jgi:hypothetical protein